MPAGRGCLVSQWDFAVFHDVTEGKDYDHGETCPDCLGALGTQAVGIEGEAFAKPVEFFCARCWYKAAFWVWSHETPCVDRVLEFNNIYDLKVKDIVALHNWIAQLEAAQCHPTLKSNQDCRNGTRTDCHWCNNHKGVVSLR